MTMVNSGLKGLKLELLTQFLALNDGILFLFVKRIKLLHELNVSLFGYPSLTLGPLDTVIDKMVYDGWLVNTCAVELFVSIFRHLKLEFPVSNDGK